MKVQLKQPEIIAALTLYLANQGINVSGKDVSVEFTAGRKESGLSAEINITEAQPAVKSGHVMRSISGGATATAALPTLPQDEAAPAATIETPAAPQETAAATGTTGSSLFN